jgi:hypothetical protein
MVGISVKLNRMKSNLLLAWPLLLFFNSYAQTGSSTIDSFRLYRDIKVTIDRPADLNPHKKTIIAFFALPNGNTTEQTMGKKMQPGDDWHYDIQHIAAQTRFIRMQIPHKNFVVIYLENNFKAWPAWKQNHPDFKTVIPHLVDSLYSIIGGKEKFMYLNGHSGGGSFIFGYLAGVENIPQTVSRISFLDSDYGYDSSYYPKIRRWLATGKNDLNVFAYNDSLAIYNGKPVVSPTGGTWYRSHLLLQDLEKDYSFTEHVTDSLIIDRADHGRIQFFFKLNLNRGIYHTQQVELNGFIHSILCGTARDSKDYIYYGNRAYQELIE